MAEQNNSNLPEHWHQLDHDEGDEHIYVHKTDSDPHYYDKSVEIVINNDTGEWGVYARTGRDRDSKQVFFQSYTSKEEAQKKIRELMEKGMEKSF